MQAQVTSIDITGLALAMAGTCDGCGNDAVELLIVREEDYPSTRYCRACVDEDWWLEPGAEFITGEVIS